MIEHPDRSSFSRRIAVLGRFGQRRFSGTVYRFISPRHSTSNDIVSGAGGLHANGRWNFAGCCRLSYTSLSPETALPESLAHVRYFNLPDSSALPRLLVSLKGSLSRVLFLTDGHVRQRLKLGANTIRHHDWRKENRQRTEAVTQAWGRSFADAGYEAILVQSAANHGENLIVFPENLEKDSIFEVENEVKWG